MTTENEMFNEAKELLTDAYSCFRLISAKKHVVLSPKFLGNVKYGLIQQLNTDIKQFSADLDGVLIAYNNVRIIHPSGVMLDDLPHIHFDIQADFIVFKPMVGCTLKAVANKLGRDHIGCLVHGRFNASIPRNPNSNSWAGSRMRVGQEFLFEVINIYCNNNFLSIKGALLPGSISFKVPTKRRFSDATSVDLVDTVDTNEDVSYIKTPKKRKKHSKEKSADGHNASLPETVTSSKKKKHSRKDNLHESGISMSLSETLANDERSGFFDSDSAFISDTSIWNESSLSLNTNKGKKKKKKHKVKDESISLIGSDTSLLNDLPLLIGNGRSHKTKHKNKDESSYVTDTDTSFIFGTSLLSESSQILDKSKSKKKKHTHKHKYESSSGGMDEYMEHKVAHRYSPLPFTCPTGKIVPSPVNKTKKKKHTHKHKYESSSGGMDEYMEHKVAHRYSPLPFTCPTGKIVPSPVNKTKKAEHKHNMEIGLSVGSDGLYSAVASNNIELSQSTKKHKHKKIKIEIP